MKACESGFHMRQILWQYSSWLLSNGLLSATLKTSGTHRQNAPMTVIVTSPCLLQLQCIHRSTLPITDMSHCHEVILTDVQPCPR